MEEKILTTVKSPVIMNVSIHSNIAQKLNFLAQAIKDIKDAKTQLVYIECFNVNKLIDGEDKEVRVIRFSTDVMLWTEINPVNKFTSTILEKSVAVNLYELYNIITNCQNEESDIISFKIDEKNSELCISSFYNELREYDELEVCLKIHNIGFPRREFPSLKDDKKPIMTIELDQMALYSIIKLNTENNTDGVNIVIKKGKISFQTNYNGLKMITIIKQYKDQIFIKDLNVFIPFYILHLIAGTGDHKPFIFNIYDNVVIVESLGYNFSYKIDKIVEPLELSNDKYEEFCILDPANAESVLKMVNNINKPSSISTVCLKKIEDQIMEIFVEYEGRYKISALLECLMRTDKPLMVDADILQGICTFTLVDGIKIQRIPDKNVIYIKYENEILIKEICYNHEEFHEFRTKVIKKD